MRPFLSRYPGFFANSPEFRDIQQALEPELLDLWSARDGALEQLCVETATWGLRYWEETLGLPAEEGDGLEARRARVRARLMGADVTTVALVERVGEICIGIPVKVWEYPNQFQMELLIDLGNGLPRNLEGLAAALREIMPAHLGWGFRFSLKLKGKLHIGGGFGASALAEIPAKPDKAAFCTALNACGSFHARAAPGLPEDTAPPPAASMLRTGCVCAIFSANPINL